MAFGRARRVISAAMDSIDRIRSAPALVLMYHRVASLAHDVHELAVEPAHFRAHMELIAAHYQPITTTALARRAQRGAIPAATVCVTLDDGYADNFREALPILESAGVPATMFIVTDPIGETLEYWWDRLERLLLTSTEQKDLSLPFTDGVRSWTLGAANRRAPHDEIHRYMLLTASSEEREELLSSIAAQLGAEPRPRPSHRVMTLSELESVASSPSVEIGAHTATHPSLSSLSPDEQSREIRSSIHWLRQRLDRPVTSFSYPHGHYTPHAISTLADSGIEAAVTTDPVPWRRRSNPLAMGRLAVGNWDADRFAMELSRFSEAG